MYEFISGNTATRSAALIIISEESDNFGLAAHTSSLVLAPTSSITQGAQQKVKACKEARSEICLCSA